MMFLLGSVFVPSAAHASDRSEIDAITYIGENDGLLSRLSTEFNISAGFPLTTYTAADGLFSFNNRDYAELSKPDRRTLMETVLGGTRESGLAATRKNKLYNFIADQDTAVTAAIKTFQTQAGADVNSASNWMRPVMGPLSTILGVLCLIIFISMMLSVTIDLAFMTLPPLAAMLSREDGKRPLFVSQAAVSAVKISEASSTSQGSKDSIIIYLRTRVLAWVLVTTTLLLLITGQIWGLFLDFWPW